MKVCLVFPRLVSQLHGLWPPLGIIQLGTILAHLGYEVKLIDSSFDSDLTKTKEKIRDFAPEVLGVTALTDIFDNACEVIRYAKSLGCLTIMGGPHPTLLPQQTLDSINELDFIGIGEGEQTLPELLAAVCEHQDVQNIRGIAFKRNGKVVITEKRAPIGDLDSLPFPDRDLLDTNGIYLQGKAISLHAIRGCPYSCTFCHPTLKVLFGSKVRFRSAASVVNELQELHEHYQTRDFIFIDDLFTVNKHWLQELAAGLEKSGLAGKLRFSVNSRVDLLDEETACLLKRLNCYYVLFGVESGSQKILDSCRKGIRLEQTRQAFKLCHENGIRTHAYVILGLPGETHESLQQTMDLIKEISPSTLQISIATPLVGTDLYQECEAEGRLTLLPYSGSDYYSRKNENQPIHLDGLDYEDLLTVRRKLLDARRVQVVWNNIIEVLRDFLREHSLEKILFRARFYSLIKYYWG